MCLLLSRSFLYQSFVRYFLRNPSVPRAPLHMSHHVSIELKPVFHFNRIVTYRSIFFCVEVISSTLVVRKQRNTLRFATIRLKWKTSFSQASYGSWKTWNVMEFQYLKIQLKISFSHWKSWKLRFYMNKTFKCCKYFFARKLHVNHYAFTVVSMMLMF